MQGEVGVTTQTLSSFAVGENALACVVAVNANRSAEYVHYDHCIIRTRSCHIEEQNRAIQ
jgi:hypothetical protein